MLISNKTKQWVRNLKMNGTCSSVAFLDGGNRMLSSGSDGKVRLPLLFLRNMCADSQCVGRGGLLDRAQICCSPSPRLVRRRGDSKTVRCVSILGAGAVRPSLATGAARSNSDLVTHC